jgi:large subunit ribosomal protein L9
VKVIFVEDVPRVARAGETKEVADGYGRNYLLPRKLAVLANSQASAAVEAQLKKRERLQAQTEVEMAELAGKLNGMEITLKAKAGAKDRLYGSITSADIADEINNSAKLVVDRKKIELVEPIHKLGSYDVTIRFTHDIAAVIKLVVAGDKVVEEKEEEKAEAKAEEKEEKAAAVKAEKKEKKAKVKAEKKEAEGKVEEKAEKKEKKVKAEKKVEKKVEEKAEKKEKKAKAKKKVEEAGEKEAEPGE